MAAGGLSPPLSDPARPASLAERGAAEPPHAGWRRPALLTRPTEILTARGLLLGAIFIAAVRLVVLPVEDPDYWWHFAIGRWMLEHRSLPSHDVFTYVVTTHVWVDHEYLTEVGIYLLQTRFGLAGVSLFFGAVTLAALWLVPDIE